MPRTYKHIKKKYISNREKERINFIKKVKARYGNRYSYDNINYVNNKVPITIHCNVHNIDFTQAPMNHVINNGCPECYRELNSHNTETFINKARSVHGDKYDYSKVDYKRSSLPVNIICPIHGLFTNIAQNHLAGSGCHKCAKQGHIHNQKWPDSKILSAFLKKAKKKHGDKYDYSKVNVRDKKVLIRCKIHNIEFRQERRNHLVYDGCKACIAEKTSLNQEEFIRRSKLVYGDKFDYSLVKYNNSYTKVKIICKEHGPIDVIPYDHMRGKAGCPKCSASSFEQKVYHILENLKIPYIREYKIDGFDYRYDVLIPDVKLLIEIHGPQHYTEATFYNCDMSYEERVQRDKDKATIAKSNGYTYTSIKCNKSGSNINSELLCIIRSNLKYYKDGKYFKNVLDFGKYLQIDPKDSVNKYNRYKTTF